MNGEWKEKPKAIISGGLRSIIHSPNYFYRFSTILLIFHYKSTTAGLNNPLNYILKTLSGIVYILFGLVYIVYI